MGSYPTRSLTASQVMSPQLITATPRTTLEEAAGLMRKNKITGLPVVGPDGVLVGVVSAWDLAREVEDPGPAHDYYQRSDHPAAWASPHPSRPSRTVEDVMTRLVVAVEEGDPLSKVMDHMLNLRVHRVLVTSQSRPVGIISALDLVRVLQETLNAPD